jgi:hypothetical protein
VKEEPSAAQMVVAADMAARRSWSIHVCTTRAYVCLPHVLRKLGFREEEATVTQSMVASEMMVAAAYLRLSRQRRWWPP